MGVRKAMGLVEVLASLLILGGAATSILVAQGLAIEQVKTAALELEAGELAHELIASWRIEKIKTTDPHTGRLERDGWSWRRQSTQKELAQKVNAIEVTLEIVHQDRGNQWVRRFTWLEKIDASKS